MTLEASFAPQPFKNWYWAGAIASTLWMMIGCGMYLFEVTLDPATLPADQRGMVEAIPIWMWAAFATAVWVGLAGAVMLLLRRRLAVALIGVSLIAMLIQNSAYVIDDRLRESVPSESLVLPVIIMAITWTVFWFARHSEKRGWLR
jgi:hypothetical protein